MLEVIERVLKIVAALLQRQAQKDAEKLAADEASIAELRQKIQARACHRVKCNNLSKRIKSLSEEV